MTLDQLTALLGGDPGTMLLGACRLESGGTDAFGAEAIAHSFRTRPVALRENVTFVNIGNNLAVFTADEAVFADHYGDHIGRLWRVGETAPGEPEPAVAVAFDPDLAQARVAVLFTASDHPDLAADAASRLLSLGASVAADPTAFRSRAFVVRSFGDATRGAVLFAVHSLAAPPVRTPGLALAAALWDGDTVQIVRDAAPACASHVRIVE